MVWVSILLANREQLLVYLVWVTIILANIWEIWNKAIVSLYGLYVLASI